MKPDERTISETDIQSSVEIGIGTKKNVVMDSQILTALMSCPRLANFRFNLNLQSIGGKTNSIECGSLVHKYLETYYKSVIDGISKEQSHGFAMTATELYIRGCPECTNFVPSEQLAKPKCGHQPDEYPGVHNTPKDSIKYQTGWQWVLDTCDQYYNYYKNDHWVPLEVEVVKGRILYEDDDIRVLWKAKLDLVSDTNQGIFPIDHKTMKQNRPTLSMNNQFMGQCILQGTRSVIINKIGFQTTLEPNEKFIRAPVSYSAARLIEWQGEILPYYANLLIMYAESGYFPPNFTECENKYGKCAFLNVCESNPDMREEELKNAFIVGPEWNPTNEEV